MPTVRTDTVIDLLLSLQYIYRRPQNKYINRLLIQSTQYYFGICGKFQPRFTFPHFKYIRNWRL